MIIKTQLNLAMKICCSRFGSFVDIANERTLLSHRFLLTLEVTLLATIGSVEKRLPMETRSSRQSPPRRDKRLISSTPTSSLPIEYTCRPVEWDPFQLHTWNFKNGQHIEHTEHDTIVQNISMSPANIVPRRIHHSGRVCRHRNTPLLSIESIKQDSDGSIIIRTETRAVVVRLLFRTFKRSIRKCVAWPVHYKQNCNHKSLSHCNIQI